ncbi:(ZYRO0F14036g) [Zygosaccharomyces parabailii]|nr:(ZYRO0F14036g) [Zygosaccharomyces parabailii]
MDSFEYSKETIKLLDFAQKCIENSRNDDDTVERLKIEMKNRRDFRKNLRIQHAIDSGRYDLVDEASLLQRIPDYPTTADVYYKVDPSSCQVELTSEQLFQKSNAFVEANKSDSRDHFIGRRKLNSHDENRQKLLQNAQNNTDLIKTLLGNTTNYVDLHQRTLPPPPPPPPPPIPVSALLPESFLRSAAGQPQLGNLSQYPPEINQLPNNNNGFIDYPLAIHAPVMLSQNNTNVYYPQLYQAPYYSPPGPIPVAHSTSTLPPPDLQPRKTSHERQERKPSRSNSRVSKMPAKRKVPKSLKRMDSLVKKHDLDT